MLCNVNPRRKQQRGVVTKNREMKHKAMLERLN